MDEKNLIHLIQKEFGFAGIGGLKILKCRILVTIVLYNVIKLQIDMLNLNHIRPVCIRHTLDMSSIKTHIHTSSMICSKVGKRRKVSNKKNMIFLLFDIFFSKFYIF